MSKPEIYISVDIEADGPIPGPYSMLQLGAAAFDLGQETLEERRTPISTYECNFKLLPGAKQDPKTMAWWKEQGGAYGATRLNQLEPKVGIRNFIGWCSNLSGKPVIIGYPLAWDFMYVYWYCMRFGHSTAVTDRGKQQPPFGFSGMDLKTLAWMELRILKENKDLMFRNVGKRGMPEHWFEGAPHHNHDGLTDAIGQGVMFVNIMEDREF